MYVCMCIFTIHMYVPVYIHTHARAHTQSKTNIQNPDCCCQGAVMREYGYPCSYNFGCSKGTFNRKGQKGIS